MRWGGEEFLLPMPRTRPADAAVVLERLRRRLASAGFDALAPGLAVSFCAGLTNMRAAESHEAAIARADQALYRAKREGRDRVVAA
jgi:diguanylate cyclase (GGDEF)-like protein